MTSNSAEAVRQQSILDSASNVSAAALALSNYNAQVIVAAGTLSDFNTKTTLAADALQAWKTATAN